MAILVACLQDDENHSAIKIKFLARGEHFKAIQKKGLKVITKNTEFTAHPTVASNNAKELGIADYILICTKSYDLEATLEQLRPCINDQTILLPLLNGVDSKERIEKLFPNNLVLDGCVYIVARLTNLVLLPIVGTYKHSILGTVILKIKGYLHSNKF